MSHRYYGREFTPDEIERIRQLIAQSPDCLRAELSRRTCQLLGWVKPDGGLKDMSCRLAMLAMQEDSLITLPAPRPTDFTRRLEPTRATDPEPGITQPVHQLRRSTTLLCRHRWGFRRAARIRCRRLENRPA